MVAMTRADKARLVLVMARFLMVMVLRPATLTAPAPSTSWQVRLLNNFRSSEVLTPISVLACSRQFYQ